MNNIVTVRASSWQELFDCPMRWEAKNLRGIRLPSSGAAHLGTSLHASTAVFDQGRILGNRVTADESLGAFVDTLYHPEEEVVWDEPRQEAEKIGRRLHLKYCAEVAPAHEYTNVEMRCEALDVDMGEGLTIRLTGTTDRVRKLPTGEVGIADLKSGKRRVNKEGVVDARADGPQLGVYELLAEHVLGIPITAPAEVIGLQTTATGNVGTAILPNVRHNLIGTSDKPGLLQMAANIIRSGSFYPNPKSQLCGERWCPLYKSCKYHN